MTYEFFLNYLSTNFHDVYPEFIKGSCPDTALSESLTSYLKVPLSQSFQRRLFIQTIDSNKLYLLRFCHLISQLLSAIANIRLLTRWGYWLLFWSSKINRQQFSTPEFPSVPVPATDMKRTPITARYSCFWIDVLWQWERKGLLVRLCSRSPLSSLDC